jgi:hypothetical protein
MTELFSDSDLYELGAYIDPFDISPAIFQKHHRKSDTINTFHSHRLLNQLRVFVTRSRHKCSIGLNRLRVIWDFNNQTNSISSVNSG